MWRLLLSRSLTTKPTPSTPTRPLSASTAAGHPSSNLAGALKPKAPAFTMGDEAMQKEFDQLVKQRQEEDQGRDRHRDAPKVAKREFEGEENPATGEVGGPKGKEPTRYGDWERKGRVFDF
ncbi:hypothetical protein HK101_004683 [Irineochytrium annulatum]|nr:hypothetical protein HK101_004683 [Irineochytrium annulatum]